MISEKEVEHSFPWAVSLGAGGATLVIIVILVFCARRKVEKRRHNDHLANQAEVDRLTRENTERNRWTNQRSLNSENQPISMEIRIAGPPPPPYEEYVTKPSLY